MTRLGYPTDPSTLFLRATLAQAVQARIGILASDYAAQRWGRDSDVVEVLKASVGGGELESSNWATSLAAAGQDFLELVDSQSLIGRLQFVRKVPPATPFTYTATGATASWVGQSRAIPVSVLGLGSGGLMALKLATILVVSNTLLESMDPRAEALVKDALILAIRKASDFALVDPSVSGTAGVEPASITNGVSGLTSSGDLAADVAEMLEGFGGDLATSSFIASPALVAQIILSTGGVGLGAGVGLRGGTLLGLPLLVSTQSESTSSGATLVLVDGARVAIVDEGIGVSRSNDATVEMSDSPAGRTDTPTAATQNPTSMLQEDATAFRALRRVNWFAAPGAVSIIEDIAYGM